MRKYSRDHDKHPDLIEACRRLVETADAFVNRAPRQKRLEAERSALFDALSHAQLVLSVTRLPGKAGKGSSKREKSDSVAGGLEDRLKQSMADLAKSQHALEQLDYLMEPVVTTLDNLQDKAKEVQTVLKTALRPPGRVLPFRRSK
jgi:hypothetical protein